MVERGIRKGRDAFMSVVVVVSFFAKDGGLDELISVMHQICPETRAFAGCLSLKMCVERELNKVQFFQEWETKSHQEAYGDWRMANGFDLVDPLIDGEPGIVYFDVHTTY